MPNNHINRALRNSEAFTARMQQSKKEIEQLRAEYERLLERGVQAGTSNITDTDKEKEILSKREDRDVVPDAVKTVSGTPVNTSNAASIISQNLKVCIKRKPPESSRPALDQVSPKKAKHYNVEDAREYIRKQRERRLQQQKQLKENDNAIEVKRQKLKDLHQRSLQIVARNRQRSKSREKQKSSVLEVPELHASVPPQISSPGKKPLSQVARKPHLSILQTVNITHRASKTKEVQYVKSSAKSDDAKIKAATLIQAYFRGHMQRRLYRNALKQRLSARQVQSTSQTTVKQNANQVISQVPTETAEEQHKKPEKNIPDWLQPEPPCHPFNFINSVKRKLNVALSTPVRTSDVGIQSTFLENCTPSKEEHTPSGYKLMKEKIESSLNSKKSDKEINANIQRSIDAIRKIQREQLTNEDTANNRTTGKQGKHNDHEKKGFLNLDPRRLEKLKLHSDHSDSDTSKNIPDISLESRCKSSNGVSIRSTLVSEPVDSVYRHPKEPPPKPKRLSRHALHGSDKTSVSKICSETQKFAKHAEQHLDEYKLNINAEKLKNIQLKRGFHNMPCPDSTMLNYEESRKSQPKRSNSQSSITSNERDTVLGQNSGHSTNINTVTNNSQILHSRTSLDSKKKSETSHETLQSLKSHAKSEQSGISSISESQPSHSHESQKVEPHCDNPPSTQYSRNSSRNLKASIAQSNQSNSQKIASENAEDPRRDSTISGNVSRYTKTFDSYATEISKHAKLPEQDHNEDVVPPGDTTEIPENLLSFRQYMKEINDSPKIIHTPFQPRAHGAIRGANAEKRLREVISKVNLLDKSQEHREITRSSSESAKTVSVKDALIQGSGIKEIENKRDSNKTDKGFAKGASCDKAGEMKKVAEVQEYISRVSSKANDVNGDIVPSTGDKLVSPNVNLIVMKHTEDDKESKLSGIASTDTLANTTTNQIHVKFEAELHLLNDFNESLKQIMNIEKSMLDLQTKYNLQPTIRETKDTQTSVLNSLSRTKSNTNASTSSIIERSINFTRGSDISADNEDRIIILHQNKNIVMDSSRGSSTLNISDITLNDSLQSTQNATTLNTSAMNATDMDVTTGDNENPLNKVNSAGLSVDMFDQLIQDEDARIENLKAVLKIREKTLLDRTKGELTWLEIQKKHLLETGQLHEASLLKKKQRGIILKLQEETNEMQRLREAQKAASKERKSKLKEQRALIKAQLSGPHLVTRIRRSSERRSSGPVKVYQSEYYQSETSVSRKSSASEGVVYASRSASIISRVSDAVGTAAGEARVRHEPPAVATRTEIAKRSLQMREAALQRRRKEAEDLLRWHQKLVREERKIADLEMAASNVINQATVAEGDKFAFKGAAVPSIWSDVKVNQKGELKQQTLGSIDDVSVSSKQYSTDFDSDRGNAALEKGLERSESTLNEIMQNINNITDEISELYKLSSIQKDAKKVDGVMIDSDSISSHEFESHSSKASIISKPKSIPEVSVKAEEVADTSIVKAGIQRKITSKPDVIDSQTSSHRNKSIIRIQSKELSLHEIQLPERVETEDDISSMKSEVLSESPKSNSSAASSNHIEIEDVSRGEMSDTTVKDVENGDLKHVTSKESYEFSELDGKIGSIQSENNLGISVSNVSIEKNTVESVPGDEHIEPELNLRSECLLDTQNVSHIPSENENENLISTIDESVVSNAQQDLLPSSKDVSVETVTSALDVVDDANLSEELNKTKASTASNLLSPLPSSMFEGAVEKTQSCIKSEVSNASDTVEILSTPQEVEVELSLVNENSVSDSIVDHQQVGNKEKIFNQSEQSVGGNASESNEFDLAEQIQEDESLDSHLNSIESRTSKSSVVEEGSIPIIGIKIEERKHDTIDAEKSDSVCVELTKENESESIQESLPDNDSSITDDCEVEAEEESNSKKSMDVKKRVSKILADANLNASIEEKSPRLPDIYVTTYDVISPDNSPELGSPVDSSKAKSKDIYGIGNEAQELLKKQLAIEQEIKQIERQQKEQLPYIFVREIPNKPPPPYTPPVQQASSIVPATPAQIEEIAPQLAGIFHRGFVEKTLEYITFLDTKLDQLDHVDKICAEFLFDIAKDYAVHHYKQFVEPDEKAPLWMKLNKPKPFKRPLTRSGLEAMLKKKLKQLFAFEKSDLKESMIIKWSRKKRDHVDELLVVESQTEEAEWTNYDQDELIVREEVTTGLLDMLIEETAMCLRDIFAKRQVARSHC